MLKDTIIAGSPLYNELRRNELDFMVYYIRYPYDKINDCRGLPCAVVVTTMNKSNIFARGISVCSSSERSFNALRGFEIATTRVLKANKTKLDLDFVYTQKVDRALETVKNYSEIIGVPLKIYQYNAVLTKKEDNHQRNPGWIHLIV